jgi:hypothetical protein
MEQRASDLTLDKPANQIPAADEVSRLIEEAEEEWEQSNGKGFMGERKLSIHGHRGKIPGVKAWERGIACSVDEGEYRWVSYFHGSLFGYDKARDVYFAVWVPESEFDWVHSMVAGDRYLWLGIVKYNKILVFDKEAPSLELVAVPELREASREATNFYTDDTVRSITLSAADSSLYSDGTRLTLPDYVNAENEFTNAGGCAPPPATE